MSKKQRNAINLPFRGGSDKRKGMRGLSLSGTWGNGKNNALTTGWGGKNRNGGGGLIPRTYGGRNRRATTFTPAAWEKRRKAKGGLLARVFGLFRRCRAGSQLLGDVWSKRKKAARGSLLSVVEEKKRGKRKPAPGNIMAVFDEATSRNKNKELSGAPRSILGALGTAGQMLKRRYPRELINAVEEEYDDEMKRTMREAGLGEPQLFASNEQRAARAAQKLADFSTSDDGATIEAKRANKIIAFLRELLGLA